MPISGTPAPAPLPSPLQKLRPVIHARWWPFGLDGETRAAVGLGCARAGAPALGVIVRQEDQGFDVHWNMHLVEAPGPHAGPCLDACQRSVGSCGLEAFAYADGFSRGTVRPGCTDSLTKHSLFDILRTLRIEEDSLDRRYLAGLSHRDKQRWLKESQPSRSFGAPRVVAQVFERCPNIADVANVTLGKRALNCSSSLPDSKMSGFGLSAIGFDCGGFEPWQLRYPRNRANDISVVTTSVAGHEYSAVALTD